MKNSDTYRRILADFLTVQAEITLSIGILGSIFAKNSMITYHYFFLPLILGIICMIPCLITYFKEDLTMRQIMAQRIIEFFVLEIVIIATLYYILGNTINIYGYIAIGVSILALDIASYGIKWIFEKDQADRLNEKLKEYQQRAVPNDDV